MGEKKDEQDDDKHREIGDVRRANNARRGANRLEEQKATRPVIHWISEPMDTKI